jgi:CPA1 family monovalent cation:H+ antiporter
MTTDIFDTAAVLVVLAALFSYANHRFLRLPPSIGLMLSGLVASLAVLALGAVVSDLEGLHETVQNAVESLFPDLLMHGMLSFLLFAGALHMNLDDLLAEKVPILSLATAGVLISTAIIGLGSYALFQLAGVTVALPYCLVFGALISPTDPIAVIGIMKTAGAPKRLEVKMAGESLFNDGVGIVVFLVLLDAASGSHHGETGLLSVGTMFLREVVGGVGLGLFAGFVVYQAMKTVDEPNLEVLLSLALVMGITAIGFKLHTSAPLACVVAGLFIGNHGRRFAMSDSVTKALDLFWSFTDHTLNGILFLFLGLEAWVLNYNKADGLSSGLGALVLLIPLTLLGRLVCVWIPVRVLRRRYNLASGTVSILTWGGLRGGISVALALSLPPFEGRDAVLTATYGIVVFSILVQGLTIGRVIRWLGKKSGETRESLT